MPLPRPRGWPGVPDLPDVHNVYAASPDGTRVLEVNAVDDSAGNYDRSAISLADVKTGRVTQLTQR